MNQVSKLDQLMVELKNESPLSSAPELLLAALRDPKKYPHRALSRILDDAGVEVGETSIRRWRRNHNV